KLGERLTDLRAGLDDLFATLGVDHRRGGVVGGLKIFALDVLDAVELFDDGLGAGIFLVQRAEESRRGNLARLIDADGQRVLFRHRTFDPRPALGDDAAA